MARTHTHGDAPAHEHEGATPGHTHDEAAPGHTHDTIGRLRSTCAPRPEA